MVVNETLEGIVTDNSLNNTGIGVLVGGEMEYFLSNKLVIVVDGIMRYVFGSELGRDRYYATVGIKYTF